ncbi:hypothetical protein [Streptomyces sioyaensis]|uniref:hypothetical protein n=1 Tax=Streptomyces sioyaensis TaxID=67364 RepID=UPI0036E08933
MNKAFGKRIGITCLTALTAMLISAAPAAAHTNIKISDITGSMTFIDDGDVFKICDTHADGAAVLGRLYYKSIGGDWHVSREDADGGDRGCNKFEADVNGVGDYKMKLYWLGTGYPGIKVAESRVFNE